MMMKLHLLLLSLLLFQGITSAISAPLPGNPKAAAKLFGTQTAHQDSPIDSMCKKTTYANLCGYVMRTHSPGSHNVDAKEMLNIHASFSLGKVTRGAQLAAYFVANRTMSTEEKSCLQSCGENYADASADLSQAVTALSKSDMATVKTMLSAALTDVGTCDDGFDEFDDVVSPLAQHNYELNKLISNCLAFAAVI